jgi:hypothetical protein
VYNDWREVKDMTLCIAALAEVQTSSPKIVLCTDFKVSCDEFASESEFKARVLSPQLVGLQADSPGRAKELCLLYQDYLEREVLKPRLVAKQLNEPLVEFKSFLADRYVGRCWGLKWQDFLGNGERWFGAEEFAREKNIIANHPLRVQMTIAGFIGLYPILLEVRDGELGWKTTCSVIGSGSYIAEPALHARNQTSAELLGRTLYNVYEAKKLSESSPYVGKQTGMYVLSPRDESSINFQPVSVTGMMALQALFDKFGPKPIEHPLKLAEDFLMGPLKVDLSTPKAPKHDQ